MKQSEYVIHYRTLQKVGRSTRQTMKTYLESEEEVWTPFLEYLHQNPDSFRFQNHWRALSGAEWAASFQTLLDALSDPRQFSDLTNPSGRRPIVCPPPSDAIEGRLILGLFAADRSIDAVTACTRFIADELQERMVAARGDISLMHERGAILLAAAHVSAVLPFQKPTASDLKIAKNNAEKQLTILDTTISQAEQINADHSAGLEAVRNHVAAQAAKLRGIFIRAERRRGRRYCEWIRRIDSTVSIRFDEAEKKIEAIKRLVRRQQNARQKEFDCLKDLFYTQLRLRAPVELWGKRASEHVRRSRVAYRNFWISASFAVILGIFVPFLLGDYISDSFTTSYCLSENPDNCVKQLSAKGPLTVGGLLLTISLLLWVTRLQYRIFLSERHLSLDADEKKAFAETFMALKEGASVDVSNETIVLASLFRPTQDGLIKDQDGNFDFSAAAILAKQMAK